MMLVLVLLCLLAVFYAYFGYPLILWACSRSKLIQAEAAQPVEKPKSVAIVITVRNEESVIVEKLKNTLALNYLESTVAESDVEVIVASDGSTDGTDTVVESHSESGVRLVRLSESRGKEFAQQAAVGSTQAEVIFFTDAKTELAADALNNGLRYFEDPTIGALSSIDRIITSDGEQSGEGFYVRYEMWLRKLESMFCTLIGLSGSCFAVRRQLCEPFRTDVPSDFALLLRARELNYRGVLGEDVICSYGAVKTERQEFNRKVRTVLRGITTFFVRREVLNPMRDPLFTFELVSHKLCRWLVPWWLLLAAVCTLVGAASSCFLQLVLFGGMVFLALAAVAFGSESCRNKPVFKVPLFFIVTNAAIFVAWLRYLSGKRSVQWNPSVR